MAASIKSIGKSILRIGSLKKNFQEDPNRKTGGNVYPMDFLTGSPFNGSLVWKPEDILHIPTVSACVNIIATTISRLPLQLVKKNGDIVNRVPSLFRQLSPEEPLERTIEALVRGLLIYGNSYLIAQSFSQSTGFPTSAFVPPVDQVTISEYYAPGEGIKARIDYQEQPCTPP